MTREPVSKAPLLNSLLHADANALAARYPVQMRGDFRYRAVTIGVVFAAAALAVFSMVRLGFSIERFGSGFANLRAFLALMLNPTVGSDLPALLLGLAQTLAIAFLGTLLAAVFAFPVGFLAAKNVLPGWLIRFFLRRSLDTARSIDVLIWALVWINVVGLTPFAGVLAIATSDFPALSKLFSEAIENASIKPGEGVSATGGGPFARIRFGLLPEVLPVMASQVLYFFESNTRSATIIGIVGAGGIGRFIKERIDQFEWEKVSFIIILILITVAVIDFTSSRLRFAMIGRTPPL